MRSGFLNASPSASPAPSSSSPDHSSRHKRKFRIDQQPSLPFPAPACSDGDGSRSVVTEDSALDCGSLSGRDVANDSSECCSSTKTYNTPPQDRFDPLKSLNPGHVSVTNCGFKASESRIGFQHDEYEELQGPDWDLYSEVQLEEMLVNMLDALYKDAMKRIMSHDYSQEHALDAVLRNGKWKGRDAVTSIVESSLAWLRSSEAKGKTKKPCFSDFKEMGGYVLAEMVTILRKVRPFLSKGDAMWCLLMCDMNVEEDAVPSSHKDAASVAVTSSQSNAMSSPSLSNVPASSFPLPLQIPHPLQPCVLSPRSLVNTYKDNRSAFSPPSFSSSPIGKVAAACRQGNPDKSWSSSTSSNSIAGNQIQEQEPENVNSSNSHQLPSAGIPTSVQTTNLGLYLPEDTSSGHYLGKSHCLIPGHLASNVNIAESCSVSNVDKQMAQIVGTRCMSQPFDTTIRSSVSGQTTSEAAAHTLKCSENFGPFRKMPGIQKDRLHTELQIGNTTIFPGHQSSTVEGWMDAYSSQNVNSPPSTGTVLSLATASKVTSESTEVSSEIKGSKEDSTVNNTQHDLSINRILGCTDVGEEERKTDMQWQLVDRVKDLEAQLQEWTEWAQQKVMQAARRLSKDTAELKALRLEREEYMRMKMEKQAVEETTMKKLSEMENALRKALSQVDRANTTAHRLEAENAEVRAEMEAAKLTAAESVSVCQEVTSREKKSMKKAQQWEKQKTKLQEELVEGKRRVASLLQQQSQAEERLQQAEVRWRQEKRAKEEALARAESEKRAKEQFERSAKRREEALQRKSDMETQHYRDEIQKLECEIAQIKLSSGLKPSLMKWGHGLGISSNNMDTCTAEKLKQMNARLLSDLADLQDSQKDIHRDRECVMCMSEEMSVVFLPCAHQVVCIKCNDLHKSRGLRDCPSCRTPIQQRIRVYGIKS